MLKDASAAGAPAPASLNGVIPGDEAWTERKRPAKNPSIRSIDANESPRRLSAPSANKQASVDLSARSHSDDIPKDGNHRHRSSTLVKLNPSTARPVTAKDVQPVSSRGATSLQPSNSPSLVSQGTIPSADSAVSRLTVSSLLDQLTEIHDRQQTDRKAEWDKWMRKRNGRTGWSGDMIGISQMGPGKDPEEWKSFMKLVRRGIPLAYRALVWSGELQ